MNASFTPAPTRKAQAGWTVERQTSFIRHLATHGSVTRAAAFVGVHPSSAYRLRARPGAAGFAEAWDTALAVARSTFLAIAMDRAIHGTRRQFWQNGKLIGEQTAPSDKLLMHVLANYRARRTPEDVEMALRALNPAPLEVDETQQMAGADQPLITDCQ